MTVWIGTSRPAARASRRSVRLSLEVLETRLAPAIRLDLVALHEFGHSLGLGHDTDASKVSIMDPYYNADYDIINDFNVVDDPAVAALQTKLANGTFAWTDSPADSVIDITYSFIKDGAKLDSGAKNTLFATMNTRFGAGSWQSIFTDALNAWEVASNGKLHFVKFDGENGTGNETAAYAFNTSGQAQNDYRFGDIRIGAHRMDGVSKVLAHAYYPSSTTGGGDAHFDSAESWVDASAPLTTEPGGSGGGAKPGALHGGDSDNLELDDGKFATPLAEGNDGMQMVVVEGLRAAALVNIRFDVTPLNNATTNATIPQLIAAPLPASAPSYVIWFTDPTQLEEAPAAEPQVAPMQWQLASSVVSMDRLATRVVPQFDDLYLPALDWASANLDETQAPALDSDADVERLNPGALSALAAILVGGASPWLAREDSREIERKRRS